MQARWRSTGARVRVGRVGSADPLGGIATVTLENSVVRVTFASSKGAEITEFVDKRIDVDFCSYSDEGPGPARPSAALAADPVSTFHDGYTGGWQHVFPNGGAPSSYRGAALAQHAESAGAVWQSEFIRDSTDEVIVRFTTDLLRVPFTLVRTVTLSANSTRVEFDESATNDSPTSVHAMWGQHLTFGRPFLHEGFRITLPPGVTITADQNHPGEVLRDAVHTWPYAELTSGGATNLSFVPSDGAPSEMLYLHGFDAGWYELSSETNHGRIRVEWDAQQLPFLWMWREFGQSVDYPFWGMTYALGLEPFSSMPTAGLRVAVDNGTAMCFAAGESKSLRWAVDVGAPNAEA